MCQLRPNLKISSLLLATAYCISACGPSDAQPKALESENSATHAAAMTANGQPLQAEAENDIFWVGNAAINIEELHELVQKFSQTFGAFGPNTLAWHLLQGGVGPAAIMHKRLAEESATAKIQADEIAARIQSTQDFFREYQATDAPADGRSLRQPTPFGLGARVAAHFAAMEAGEWVGPVATQQGWEIVLLESRVESRRSVAGVKSRSILLPVGSDDDRRVAREEWAKLPIRGPAEFLRTLPATFRRGRTSTAPE